MAKRSTAVRRRRLANNPAVHPEMRWYINLLNKKGISFWGTTSTTTSTTSTTTTTTTS